MKDLKDKARSVHQRRYQESRVVLRGIRVLQSEAEFRKKLIEHILMMKQYDPDYAREALRRYHAAMPWLDLLNGVRDALR